MNILIIAEDFYCDTRNVRWNFVRETLERGNKVHVISPKQEFDTQPPLESEIQLHHPLGIERSNSIFTRFLHLILISIYSLYICYTECIDIVHSTTHLAHPAAKFTNMFGFPVVNFIGYTPSNSTSNYIQTIRNFEYVFEQFIFRFFLGDIVYCRTRQVKEQLMNFGYDVHILHGVLNEEEFEEIECRALPSTGSVDIVCVGRLEPIKNHSLSIDIIDELPHEYELTIIGDGPAHDTLQSRVQDKGIEDRIHFEGRLAHKTVLQSLISADILLMTSISEAYPTVVFEALATYCEVYSLPVGILTDINHQRLHVVEKSELASVIETQNINSHDGIDTETLSKYSIKRYTDEILESFQSLR